MRIAVSGSTGLIGTALCKQLVNDGHEIVRLVRRIPNQQPTDSSVTEVRWNPKSGDIDIDALVGVEAIINLAGAGVGDHRWTDDYKEEIRSSRVLGTETLARAAAELKPSLSTFIAASAIGYYGDRGSEELTEQSTKGPGFLADVVADWEAAADPARHAGIRVVNTRTGLVASSQGGAWERMIKLFRLGVGGKLGSGDQYWSFISLRDQVNAMTHLLTSSQLEGPVNLTAPNPATNREVTKALGAALGRPTIAAVPGFALKMALGEFSTEVLSSARVLPQCLTDDGFVWQDPTIEATTASLL